MNYDRLIEGRFLRRLNRFAGLVDVDGSETLVHIANSGRMKELLVEGFRVLLKPAAGTHRKTGYDLALVDLGHTLCSSDARLPNFLLHEALVEGRLEEFEGYTDIARERTFEDSRLDLVLSGPSGVCYIEAKSVTLVVDGVGLFPDAPTVRGAKHVGTLAKAVEQGHRAAAVFVVQREDASALTPHDIADPAFGAALRRAIEKGVEAYAYRCRVSQDEIVLSDAIPVHL